MIKNNEQPKLLNNKTCKNMLEWKISKQPTMSHYIGRINAWTCYNAYAWVPFFTHTTHAFGVISFKDWVLEPWFSILKMKLAKYEVMVSIIFITLLIRVLLLALLVAWVSHCIFLVFLAFEDPHSSMLRACGNLA